MGNDLGNGFGVDAELFRPAAHAHAGALEFEVRIDAQRNARRPAGIGGDAGQRVEFGGRFDVDQHAGGDRLAKLFDTFARPGKGDVFG